jgi:predicted transposase YdaD
MCLERRLEGNLEGKLEIAANMLRKGKYAFEDIAEATGLREEQIRELEQGEKINDPIE